MPFDKLRTGPFDKAFTLIELPAVPFDKLRTVRKGKGLAFTLIELLTVIVIMLILIGVGAAVGPGVLRSNSILSTRATLRQLDMINEEYKMITGSYLDLDTNLPVSGGMAGTVKATLPAAKTYGCVNTVWYIWESIEYFVQETRKIPELGSMYKSFSDHVLTDAGTTTSWPKSTSQNSFWVYVDGLGAPEVRDPWQQFIVYKSKTMPSTGVMGGWDNGVVYASNDFLPPVVNGVPYFTSAGPDILFGCQWAPAGSPAEAAMVDNIYSDPTLDSGE